MNFKTSLIGTIAIILPVMVILPNSPDPEAGGTRDPELEVFSVSYSINGGEPQPIANEGLILLQPGHSLAIVDLFYASSSGGGVWDRVAGEAYVKKGGSWDYTDGRFADGVPISIGNHEVGDIGTWRIEEGWDRIVISLIHYYSGGYETDDRFFINLQVGQPDLMITDSDLVITPRDTARASQEVIFQATIHEIGGTSASSYAELDVTRHFDGVIVWVGAISFNLAGNDSVTALFENINPDDEYPQYWMPDRNGVYVLALKLDPEDAVLESNETNNSVYAAYQVGVPDYEVTDVSFTPSSPLAIDTTVTLRATIRNNGDSFPDTSYAEIDVVRYGEAIPDWIGTAKYVLGADESITVNFRNDSPEDGYPEFWRPTRNGIYIVGVVADPPYSPPNYKEKPHGEILETIDTDPLNADSTKFFGNNAKHISLQVGTPDFKIGSQCVRINANPFYILRDNTAEIEVTVKNEGDGPFTFPFEWAINRWGVEGDASTLRSGGMRLTLGAGDLTVIELDWIPDEEGLFIFAAVADPPYSYPDYDHPRGDIIERVDTDPSDSTKFFGNNAGHLAVNVFREHPRIPGSFDDWIRSQLTKDIGGGPGYLIRSYFVDTGEWGYWNCYSYDVALTIMYFTWKGDYESARQLLDELAYLQDKSDRKVRDRSDLSYYGSFPFAWYAPRPQIVLSDKRTVGNNAWIVMATNYYTRETGDTSYIQMARDCADWILQFKDDDGGIMGGISEEDRLLSWTSTEHNEDTFCALKGLSLVTSSPADSLFYAAQAEDVKEWVFTKATIVSDDGSFIRFKRGEDDPYEVTDVNVWGVLVFGKEGPNGENLSNGLTWCLDNTLVDDEGFDFNSDRDTAWMEITGSAVLAFDIVGDTATAQRLLASIENIQHPSGGYPYTTRQGTEDETGSRSVTLESVAAGVWCEFARYGLNPFQVPCSVNHRPVIEPIPDTTIVKKKLFEWQVEANDEDGDSLRYSDDTDLFDIDVSTGLIRFMPTDEDVGEHMVTITVSDGQLDTTATFNLTIINRVPEPPSNLQAFDTPNDQGHSITLTWTKSPDDGAGLNHVSYYRIYRSRSSEFTDPIPISAFPWPACPDTLEFSPGFCPALDSLMAMELDHTILIDSVAAGTTEYVDSFVPVNGVGYTYWLEAVAANGAISAKVVAQTLPTAVDEEVTVSLPQEYFLYQNSPNPFNAATEIRYQLPQISYVRLMVYDITGRRVGILVDASRPAGYHSVLWDGKDQDGRPVGSAVYLYRLEAGSFTETRKALLLR